MIPKKPPHHTGLHRILPDFLQGTQALQNGFTILSQEKGDAEQDAIKVHKAERNTEKLYRKALADLFLEKKGHLKFIKHLPDQGVKELSSKIMTILKKREIYRHLSNTADKMADAGEILHDIIMKNS
jgi:uncharacterized protein